jgi:uncharacterized RDD family membrane protein YckC
MSGLPNFLPDGDPAIEAAFLSADAVEVTVNADETAPPQIDRNVEVEVIDANSADANSDDQSVAGTDSWRIELAARLDRYRTRRKPRSPRYPSLLLPFESSESRSRTAPSSAAGTAALAASLAGREFVFESAALAEVTDLGCDAPCELPEPAAQPGPGPDADLRRQPFPYPYPYPERPPEQSGKVIAFPRSAAIPVFRHSGLADPVFDHARPRIVEAPEIMPPPPALGGMLIEPASRELADTGADSPSGSATIARRALAALIDGAILSAAVTAFAAIFLRLNPGLQSALNLFLHPTLRQLRESLPALAGLSVVAIALWAAYEFLFVIYTGSTPGLRATGLRLGTFDGSNLNRRLRRRRVLASLLSALSVGLGYLWCFLDQDGLCWHDRITRTHIQYESQPTAPVGIAKAIP